MEHVFIRMLGELSIQAGEVQISARGSRSKKVWVLLAYLLNHRRRITSRNELINLLWNDEKGSSNPENTLKITLHRARTLLNELWPHAGHELLLYNNGGYIWNPDVPIRVDADEFESMCCKKCDDTELQMETLLNAVSMYRGEFLGNLSTESWAVPMNTYYHNLYMQAVLDVIPMLNEAGRYDTVVTICKEALLLEVYHEPLHQYLMQALLAQGDYKGTTAAYEKLSQQMFEEMGVRPGKETVALYRTALQTISDQSLPMEEVLAYLQEPHSEGAMQCDYDYFKILTHAEARGVRRNGKATHIALLSLEEYPDKELTKKGRGRVMDNLGKQICKTLRQSDTFAQCSMTQYIIMLPQTNFENSCKVCQRILDDFYRRYPHVPAKIRYDIKPLFPNATI